MLRKNKSGYIVGMYKRLLNSIDTPEAVIRLTTIVMIVSVSVAVIGATILSLFYGR